MRTLIKINFSTFNKHLKKVSSWDNQRLYDDSDFFTPLYNETGLKWLELMKEYYLKIFYFKTSSKCVEKLIFDNKKNNSMFFNQEWKWDCKNYRNGLVKNDKNVQKIKEMQQKDLYSIYKDIIPEVFYIFPRVEKNDKYTFDFVLIVGENFNLNNFFEKDFDLIKLESVEKLNEINLTYEKVKSIFESRFVLDDNSTTLIEDKNVYKTPEISDKEYIKIYKDGNESLYDHEEYNFLIANWMANNFNQEVYVKNNFKLLCTQIWSFDKIYYKEVTKFGLKINKKYIYSVDSFFLTINEMIGKTAILNKESGELEISDTSNYNNFLLSDGFMDQDIIEGNLNKEFIKNGFIDLDKLEIIDEKK